jgi:hypothetical protein
MPTCLQSIQSKISAGELDTITQLAPNTLTPINMTSSIKQLFLMEIVRQETVKFTLNLISNLQPTNVGVTVTFYQLTDDNDVILLGSVLITEMILDFQKDFTPGVYIICIGSNAFTYTGTFLGLFTGFPVYAKFKLTVYSGSALSFPNMTVPIPDRFCNKTLYFSILDGSLPPGLIMTELGNIYGVLPNMDCIEENANLSPSQNWYYGLDGAWFPWGRQWRFLIKTWVGVYPEANTTRWFCIRVHNNWSWDRDNFKPPFEYEVVSVEDDEDIAPLDNLCCEPAKKPEPFVPVPALPVLCPCDSESSVEQATTLNFLQWYENHLKHPSDSPYIQAFVDNFKTSETYTRLMIEYGKEDELTTPLERELKAVNNLIQSYLDALENGRGKDHIDTQMLLMKDLENQKLPITVITQTGSLLTIGAIQ